MRAPASRRPRTCSFRSSRRSRRAPGIGLVLCRQIAEAHGGVLSLENRGDRRGCVARLRLPVAFRDASIGVAASRSAQCLARLSPSRRCRPEQFESPTRALSDEVRSRRHVIAVPSLLVAWHWHYGPLAEFGDWAQYMLHADALRHGRSYGDIGYIFTSRNPFIGPPVQPPGLPAVLVPLLALTDGRARRRVQAADGRVRARVSRRRVGVLHSPRRSDCRHRDGDASPGSGSRRDSSRMPSSLTSGSALSSGCIFCLADRDRRVDVAPRRRRHACLGFAALAFPLAALPLVPAVARVRVRSIDARAGTRAVRSGARLVPVRARSAPWHLQARSRSRACTSRCGRRSLVR